MCEAAEYCYMRPRVTDLMLDSCLPPVLTYILCDFNFECLNALYSMYRVDGSLQDALRPEQHYEGDYARWNRTRNVILAKVKSCAWRLEGVEREAQLAGTSARRGVRTRGGGSEGVLQRLVVL